MSGFRNRVTYSGKPNNVSQTSKAPHSLFEMLHNAIFQSWLAKDFVEVSSVNPALV